MRNLLRPDSQIISPVSELEKAGLAELADLRRSFGCETPRLPVL